MNRLYDKMFQHNIELEVKPLIDEYGHRYVMFTFRSDYDQNLTSKSTTAIVNMDDVILESDDVLELLNNYLDGLIKALILESDDVLELLNNYLDGLIKALILESDDVLELLNNYLDGLIKALDKESEE